MRFFETSFFFTYKTDIIDCDDATMIKHSLECQFRIDEVKNNDENDKNNVKIDESEQQKSMRAMTKNEIHIYHHSLMYIINWLVSLLFKRLIWHNFFFQFSTANACYLISFFWF